MMKKMTNSFLLPPSSSSNTISSIRKSVVEAEVGLVELLSRVQNGLSSLYHHHQQQQQQQFNQNDLQQLSTILSLQIQLLDVVKPVLKSSYEFVNGMMNGNHHQNAGSEWKSVDKELANTCNVLTRNISLLRDGNGSTSQKRKRVDLDMDIILEKECGDVKRIATLDNEENEDGKTGNQMECMTIKGQNILTNLLSQLSKLHNILFL